MKPKTGYRDPLLSFLQHPHVQTPHNKSNTFNSIQHDDTRLQGLYLLLFYLFLILLLSLSDIICAYAQTTTPSQSGLHIGDKVPETFWNQPVRTAGINGHSPEAPSHTTATLASYKGKLIILDFWATWCSPCVAMIPKMDSLQQVYNGSLQFVPVAYQKREEVLPFLGKLRERTHAGLNLPEVTGDTLLQKLFPHNALPHYVWIGTDGTIKAITEFDAVTGDNISLAIAGKEVLARLKQDGNEIPNDYRKPMLINGNAGDGKNLIYHSVLTSYTEGLPLMSAVKKDSTSMKIVAYNATLFGLYRLAYTTRSAQFNRTNTLFEVADKSKLTSPAFGLEYMDYLRSGNGYCYELIVPLKWAGRINQIMQDELKKFFPYTAVVEQRESPCYALKRTSPAARLSTKEEKPSFTDERFGLKMTNQSLDYLLMRLRMTWMQRSPLPLVNQTDYRGKVDLSLDADLTDMASLNKALEKYGLQFVRSTTKVPFLVIRDAPETK